MKRLVYILSIAMLLVLALATFLEKNYGTIWVQQWVYSSWWFMALWAILALASMIYILKKKLYKRTTTFLIHLSLVVILIGAFITHVYSFNDSVHLRLSKPTHVTTNGHALPFSIKLKSFNVETYADAETPKNFISVIEIPSVTEVMTISMNNIGKYNNYRFYQSGYDSDLRGSTLLVTHDPWGIAVTYLGYFMLFASMLWFLTQKMRKAARLWLGALLTFATIAVITYINIWSKGAELQPVLRTPLLAFHVGVIIIAYILFLFLFFNGIVALISHKITTNPIRLQQATARCKVILYPATFLLIVGIFVGAIWANISWGSYWSWDSKEVWALITLLIYSTLFHTKSIASLRNPLILQRYIVFAFLSILFTYFGVNYFLAGMHSYA